MNSGSGAVHDYLSSRKDFYSPFGTSELLIVDPMGQTMFLNCYQNFSFLIHQMRLMNLKIFSKD